MSLMEYENSAEIRKPAGMFGIGCGGVVWMAILAALALKQEPSNSPGDGTAREFLLFGLALTVFAAAITGAVASGHELVTKKLPAWRPTVGLALNLLPWLIIAVLAIVS
jgi:hypothetical protein